jgi:hypothetical protein
VANKTIGELTIVPSLDGSTLFEVEQGGAPFHATDTQIKDFIVDEIVDTDGTMAANSDDVVPSQKAVNTRINALLAAQNALVFSGVIDCSANPNYPAADAGHVYVVSVTGKIGGASGVKVKGGDQLLCIVDSTASGNHATVGASWNITEMNLDGAVTGPISATDNRVAVFDGVSGALIKDGGLLISAIPTGQTTVGLALLQLANPSAVRFLIINADNSVSSRTAAQMISDLGVLVPSIQSVTSSATVTPVFGNDEVKITAQATGLTLANPTGTAIDGWGVVIRIKDNGTARSIAYGTQYRAIDVTLPITTVISKTLYLAMVFNNDDTKWDVLAVGQEA